jgi:hypothetical protein
MTLTTNSVTNHSNGVQQMLLVVYCEQGDTILTSNQPLTTNSVTNHSNGIQQMLLVVCCEQGDTILTSNDINYK